MLLIRLLARILSGEPYRKATPAELRWYSAFFALLPVVGFGGVYLGRSILDHAGPLGIWIFSMIGIFLSFGLVYVWARFVPASTSWILGAIVWLITLTLAFTGHIPP